MSHLGRGWGLGLADAGFVGTMLKSRGAVFPGGGVCAPPPALLSLLCRVTEGINKEVLGILVSYRVKVKLVVSRGG